jgi:hypothetical protein
LVQIILSPPSKPVNFLDVHWSVMNLESLS